MIGGTGAIGTTFFTRADLRRPMYLATSSPPLQWSS
jgi:hypothetical protein